MHQSSSSPDGALPKAPTPQSDAGGSTQGVRGAQEAKAATGSGPVIPALRYDNAAFAYGNSPILTGVTGEVLPGEALALIGPNGAGKTTLLRGILGTVNVTGTMEILGHKPGKVPKGAIGYVPQVTDLDASFPVTVKQVVGMGLYAELGWFKRLTASHKDRVLHALERVGMADKATMRFGNLSGGQRQRVLVARSIVASPKMILLDEPFNGLDEPNRDALLEIIDSVKQEGIAVVVSTHDLRLAYVSCEKAVLLAGRQIAFGALREVLTRDHIDQAYGGRSTEGLLADPLAAAEPKANTANTSGSVPLRDGGSQSDDVPPNDGGPLREGELVAGALSASDQVLSDSQIAATAGHAFGGDRRA